MAITNKPLYTVVLLALSMVSAAPLQDGNGETAVQQLASALPMAHGQAISKGHLDVQVTAPIDSKKTPISQLTKVVSDGKDTSDHAIAASSDDAMDDGEWEGTDRSSDEMAEYVLSLRDYIDTLDDEEYDTFVDFYLKEGSEEDIFALELALDLDDPDSLLEESNDGVEFAPYEEVRGHHKSHGHHHRHHKHHGEKQCSEREFRKGLCEPIREHHHHHRKHHHGNSRKDAEDGLAYAHKNHYQHHNHSGDLRPSHPAHHRVDPTQLTQADGFPAGHGFSHPRHTLFDDDLLGFSSRMGKRNTIEVHMDRSEGANMSKHVSELKDHTIAKREVGIAEGSDHLVAREPAEDRIKLVYDLRRSLPVASNSEDATD